MKINSRKLSTALNKVAAICPTHSPNEALKFVRLMQSDSTMLLLYATNQETAITHVAPAIESSSLNLLVRPDRLSKILQGLDTEVTLDQNGDSLIVIVDGMTTQLDAPPVESLPDFSSVDAGRPYTVDAKDLRRALRVCQSAVDPRFTSNLALNGILLQTGDDLHIVSTDSRRMSVVPIPYERDGEIDDDSQEVIPIEAAKLIASALADEGEAQIAFWLQGGVSVSTETITIHTRTLAGRFPKWERITEAIPSACQLTLPVEPLLSSVQRVAVTASIEKQAIDIAFNGAGIDLHTAATDVGKTSCHIDATAPGFEITLSLNAQYLADALRAIGKDSEVEVRYTKDSEPLCLSLDDGTQYVLMPLSTE